MTHILKLQPKFFDFIKDGTKRIELRLFDEKRQQLILMILLNLRENLNKLIL